MATCPFCLEDIKDGAKKCPHCQSDLVKDQDQSRKVVYILDQGLVAFAKFALVLFGLFAVVLYTALGFHIEDSVKQIDEKSKSVAELQAKAKDISIEIQKSALSDQRELQKWKEELQRDRTFVAERAKEIEGIKSEIERIKADSGKAFSELRELRADFVKYVDGVKEEIKRNLEAIGESREHALDFEKDTAEARIQIMQVVKALQIGDAKAVATLVASVRAESKSPPQGLNVRVGLVSEVSEVGTDELSRLAAALQKQVSRDLKPIWDVEAKIEVFKSLDVVPAGIWPMMIKKDIGITGAAGIHLEKDGVPYALVTYVPGGSEWTITASHELIDMLVNPSGNRMVSGPSPRAADRGRTVEFLVEPAPPVEGSKHAYTVDGVMVSDFVTPQFFTAPKSQNSRYSFNGAAVEPRKIAIEGYMSWMDSKTNEFHQATWFSGKEPEFRNLGKIH